MAIVDQYGNPFPSRPDTNEVALMSIRDRYSSYPSQGLTPQRLAAILKEADQGDIYRQAELFEEMEEKDTHLFSILQTRKLAVQGLEWDILSFSDDARDKEIAAFVKQILENFEDFDEAIIDLLDAIGKGFSVTEIMWKIENDQAWIRDMEWKHQKKFAFNDQWDIRLLTDLEPVNGIQLPPGKFAVHKYKAKSGHPSRAGVIRVCAWMYLFKNFDIKDWVAFAEVYGKPLRLGKYPQSATKDDKEALMQALVQLGTDAAGIISEGTIIEFIETKGTTGATVYERLAQFCNAEMSKCVLGQTLTTEVGNRGSLAAGKVHNEVRQDLKIADCKALAKTIRRDIIRPLVYFNFGTDQRLPKFKFHYEEPEDLKSLSETYDTVIKFGLPVATDHIYDTFGIPKPASGQALIAPPSPTGPVQPMANKQFMVMRQGASLTDDQQSVEGLADRALVAGIPAIKNMIEPMIQIIANAQSLEEIPDKLRAAYPELDTTDFETILAQTMFIADLFGRMTVNAGN